MGPPGPHGSRIGRLPAGWSTRAFWSRNAREVSLVELHAQHGLHLWIWSSDRLGSVASREGFACDWGIDGGWVNQVRTWEGGGVRPIRQCLPCPIELQARLGRLEEDLPIGGGRYRAKVAAASREMQKS